MPDAQVALRKLGVEIQSSDGFPFRGIRFLDGSVSVDASFPNGCGIGVRRTALHGKMARSAAAAGIDLRWGRRVTAIDGDRVFLDGDSVRARWIVGTDGSGSLIRRWSGLDSGTAYQTRFGFRLHYQVAPWSDCMEIYWGPGCQIYVTPVEPEYVCVALISRDKHLRLEQALEQFPEVQARLGGVRPASVERGAVSITRRLRSVCRRNVLLVGDASGSVDAITGEGICLGLQQAVALADALAAGDPGAYESEHARIMQRPAFMASTMLLMENRPRLRRRVVQALSASPRVFAGMLAMHVGAASALDFAANGVELGWRVLGGFLV
jgi:flavin-dependent dehydrogenase